MDYLCKDSKDNRLNQGPDVGITELFNACSNDAVLVRKMIITLLWTELNQQSTSQYDLISGKNGVIFAYTPEET